MAVVVAAVVLVPANVISAGRADGGPPALRGWQAKRIAYGYTISQQRPGYLVVRVARRSRYRLAVTGHEPGYLGVAPDVTVTLVERRGYQLWVRDPFTEGWRRWL